MSNHASAAETRLEILHARFLDEFDRQSDDVALRLLAEIRTESRDIRSTTIATGDRETRLLYLDKMWRRAIDLRLYDRAARIGREIRKESAQ
jgi:hypothetical protein